NIDPLEARMESGAPDDVGRVDNGVAGHRPSIAHTRDLRKPLDACGREILPLHADERTADRDDLATHAPPDRCRDTEHTMKQEAEHHGQDQSCRTAVDAERHLARVATCQLGRVRPRHLDGDLGTGITGTDNEYGAITKLCGTAV